MLTHDASSIETRYAFDVALNCSNKSRETRHNNCRTIYFADYVRRNRGLAFRSARNRYERAWELSRESIHFTPHARKSRNALLKVSLWRKLPKLQPYCSKNWNFYQKNFYNCHFFNCKHIDTCGIWRENVLRTIFQKCFANTFSRFLWYSDDARKIISVARFKSCNAAERPLPATCARVSEQSGGHLVPLFARCRFSTSLCFLRWLLASSSLWYTTAKSFANFPRPIERERERKRFCGRNGLVAADEINRPQRRLRRLDISLHGRREQVQLSSRLVYAGFEWRENGKFVKYNPNEIDFPRKPGTRTHAGEV